MSKRQRTEGKEEKTAEVAQPEIPKCFLRNKAFVTQPAPDFTDIVALKTNGEISTVSLSDYAGKYLVLFFYPLDWTFVCPTEIIAFSDRIAEFKKLNCEILAASCDNEFSHHAWTETDRKKGGLGKISFPIISDKTQDLAHEYGVMIPDGHPLRGLFIIDGKGIIRHITKNDPPVGRDVDEVLRLVAGYQHRDAHPDEVCPMGWKPGQPTINDHQTKKLAYFEKVNK